MRNQHLERCHDPLHIVGMTADGQFTVGSLKIFHYSIVFIGKTIFTLHLSVCNPKVLIFSEIKYLFLLLRYVILLFLTDNTVKKYENDKRVIIIYKLFGFSNVLISIDLCLN